MFGVATGCVVRLAQGGQQVDPVPNVWRLLANLCVRAVADCSSGVLYGRAAGSLCDMTAVHSHLAPAVLGWKVLQHLHTATS